MNQWKKESLLKRVGKPEEIASKIQTTFEFSIKVGLLCIEVIKFFSCNDSSFITGQVLYVDGGYSVRGIGY